MKRGRLLRGMTLVLALVVAITFAACGVPSSSGTQGGAMSGGAPAGDGAKTKLTILRPGDETKVRNFLEPVIEEFMKENQDIEVEIQYESWGGWISKYPSLFQAGTQPDVVFWWDKAIRDSYVEGKLVPIEDYVDPAILEEIPDSVLETCKIDGTLYHIPVDMYGFVMFYRKDIFEQAGLDPNKPPATWDELLAACQQIQEKTDAYPIAIPGKAGIESCHEMVAEFITQSTGQPLLDENNQVTFNNEQGLAGLEFMLELMQYADPNVTEYARGDMRQVFKDGQVAIMLGDSTWAVPEFQEYFGDKDLGNTDCGVAVPPVSPTGKYNWCGLDGWAIAQEKNAEAAGRLINYLSSPQVSYLHHSIYGGMPYTSYEAEQEAFSYDFWNVFKESLSDYTPIQRIGKYHPAPSAFYTVLEPIWQEMLLGNLSAEEALQQAVEGIDELNSRYGIE